MYGLRNEIHRNLRGDARPARRCASSRAVIDREQLKFLETLCGALPRPNGYDVAPTKCFTHCAFAFASEKQSSDFKKTAAAAAMAAACWFTVAGAAVQLMLGPCSSHYRSQRSLGTISSVDDKPGSPAQLGPGRAVVFVKSHSVQVPLAQSQRLPVRTEYLCVAAWPP